MPARLLNPAGASRGYIPDGHRPYERATYGLRESNFTILTCNCCTDSARSTCVPRTVLASSVLTPHFPVDLLNDHAEHTCTILVYKDDLTGDCQLVSKMPRKAQKKTTRQDPKKRAAEDTRAASDDEVNRRCTHLQRTACTRQRANRTEIVRCKHVQLTYHLRNVRCTQPLTARRVVQTTNRGKPSYECTDQRVSRQPGKQRAAAGETNVSSGQHDGCMVKETSTVKTTTSALHSF
ncbi:hypothetical protein Bbelb_083860 [Branchiostoma belcheri]|nr:hypothetical protein Bbelb_083860 [Branchiostoma belcheri]